MKKAILIVAFALFASQAYMADIKWNPQTTQAIPNDGNIYFLDADVEINNDVHNEGVLEIRNSLVITINLKISFYNNGTLRLENGSRLKIDGGDSENRELATFYHTGRIVSHSGGGVSVNGGMRSTGSWSLRSGK